MKRRLVIAAPLVLGGCGIFSPNNISADIAKASDIANNAATALLDLIPQLKNLSVPGLTTDVLTSASAIITDIQGAAVQLKSASTVASAQSTVQAIETYVNRLVQVFAAIPLPPPANEILMAAVMVLPVLEGLLNLALPASASPAVATYRTKASARFTPPQAELYLRTRPYRH